MQRRSHRRGAHGDVALVALVALGLAPAALGDDRAASSEPSAIERLIRQEDARRRTSTDDATTVQNTWRRCSMPASERWAPEDRSDRCRLADDAVSALDPAIRTAMVAHASAAATTGPDVPRVADLRTDAFAWGAAALGLAAGVAAMCVLLGCVTLVRSHGRLRSV